MRRVTAYRWMRGMESTHPAGLVSFPGRDSATAGLNDHGFVQEEGDPFAGVRAVLVGAAAEFEAAIEAFYEPGIAEGRNDFAVATFEFWKQMS